MLKLHRLPTPKETTMTEAAIPDLTPPGKNKAAKAAANGVVSEKPAKAPKAAKAPVDPNAPKKERAPRTDYGYHAEATIHLVPGKEIKYREGHRLAWYNSLKDFDGKTVGAWETSRKAEKDPPRGWIRFFVMDGAVTLSGAPAPKAPETPKAA
jgi:hypothetical protein